jgi:hypothetical protein
MTKRIISCLLILIFCFVGFAACGDKEDGVPEGMYSVTRPGEPFILYVQGDWTDNRDSGISSAYYSIFNGVVVSARYYALPEGALLTDISMPVRRSMRVLIPDLRWWTALLLPLAERRL